MLKGTKHSPESLKKMQNSAKGQHRSPNTEFKKGNKKPINAYTLKKGHIYVPIKYTPEIRRQIGDFNRGQRSKWWKGGITPINQKLRNSSEYKQWREAVFKRDNYTCVWCGDARGGNLQADHIKPFSKFLELRFDITNGRTLCVPCHKTTDTWGYKASYV